MAYSGHMEFASRLRRLDRKHRVLRQGYDCVVRADGLVVRRSRLQRPWLLPRALVLGAVALILIKSVLIAHLGPASYQTRVIDLGLGASVDRASALVMRADPVSHALGSWLAPVLH